MSKHVGTVLLALLVPLVPAAPAAADPVTGTVTEVHRAADGAAPDVPALPQLRSLSLPPLPRPADTPAPAPAPEPNPKPAPQQEQQPKPRPEPEREREQQPKPATQPASQPAAQPESARVRSPESQRNSSRETSSSTSLSTSSAASSGSSAGAARGLGGPDTPVASSQGGSAETCPQDMVPSGRFEDVPPDSTHTLNIECVAWLGIASGVTPVLYAPNAPVTRAQMATFLARLVERAGHKLPENPADAFDDDSGSTHERRINQLAAEGVVRGSGARTYNPRAGVSRAAMGTFLANTHDLVAPAELAAGENLFDDDDGNVHEPQIERIASAGIARGTGQRAYSPAATVTRAQMATFLIRTLDVLSGQPAPVEPVPAVTTPTAPVAGAPFRAFSAASPWNRLLPATAPVHADSARILANIKANNVSNGCVLLSGTGTNTWGTPIYWAGSGDPQYSVVKTRYYLPPEFGSLRIPRDAKPMAAADGEMTVYDLERGYVAWLSRAVYDPATDRWSAGGGSIAYLSSNGVLSSLAGSDQRRNTGSHRGLNGAVVAARYDEVKAGAIEHTLRIGVRGASKGFVWPMSGSDGKSTDPYAPKQGTRLRIKPGVDLSSYRLAPDARVLATALQRYGAIIGDSTGAPVELKLEDTVQQGRGQLWSLPQNALCAIPIEAFEVLSEDFR